MKKTQIMTLAASCLLLWGGVASASTINTSYVDGTTWNVSNVSQYDTTGNTMDGLSATVTWSDGKVTTAHWSDNTGAVYSASGYEWSLTYTGNFGYDTSTYSDLSYWYLNNTSSSGLSISSLTIDGQSSDVVFDTIYGENVTPGSAWGWSISSSDSLALTANAAYSNVVSVNGVTYDLSGAHDLYSTLTIDFVGGLGTSDLFVFQADTDNVNATPEPSTMLLLGTGLAGFASIRARKRFNLTKKQS